MARVSLLQGIFPIQGLNSGLLHCRQILYHLSHRRDFYMYSIYVCVCVCVCVCVQLLQSHLTLCNLMHCSWPDSSVHRIFPEKTLEWIVILSSRGILLTQGSKLCLLPLLHCRLSHWERQPTMQSRKMDYCLYPLVCETKQYPCNNWPQMVRT